MLRQEIKLAVIQLPKLKSVLGFQLGSGCRNDTLIKIFNSFREYSQDYRSFENVAIICHSI